MVNITPVNGDYFIDCSFASQSTSRAIFGAWLNIAITLIATCIRSIYQSNLTYELVPNGPNSRSANLWMISPAATPFEVYELRSIIFQNFSRKRLLFILTSLVCILAFILSAAVAVITNNTVTTNVVTRKAIVPGRLAIYNWQNLGGATIVNLTSRVHALEKANAPPEVLFDFVPNDDSGWIYVAEDWNNSWHGSCIYQLFPAVDLAFSTSPSTSTNVSDFRNIVPSLGHWLPEWTLDNQTSQGYFPLADSVSHGKYNILITFIFYNPPDLSPAILDTSTWTSVNVSIVNFLGHNIGANASTFNQMAFQSDVHVADCTFRNSNPELIYKSRASGSSNDAASNIASIFGLEFYTALAKGTPVHQPTAQQLLRYWQAYMSCKDVQTYLPVQRRLSVSRPVVQIRLSVLVATLASFLAAVVAAVRFRQVEPRDSHGKQLDLPSSKMDWIVQAAREYLQGNKGAPMTSTSTFIAQHKNFLFLATLTPEGQLLPRVASPTEQEKIARCTHEAVESPHTRQKERRSN